MRLFCPARCKPAKDLGHLQGHDTAPRSETLQICLFLTQRRQKADGEEGETSTESVYTIYHVPQVFCRGAEVQTLPKVPSDHPLLQGPPSSNSLPVSRGAAALTGMLLSLS